MFKLVRSATVAVAMVAVAGFPLSASGQLPIPSIGIAGGVSHYHLSGTGSAPFGAVRVDIPLLTWIAEGSLGAFRPDENGSKRTILIPEAQLQFQIFPMIVRPYIGVGVGWFRAVSGPDPHQNDVTYSASAGVRAGLPTLPFGIRGELRVRGIGSGFSNRTAEWTIGISR
jgi:hypothetical protein